MREKEF